jgi:hypothetical protein
MAVTEQETEQAVDLTALHLGEFFAFQGCLAQYRGDHVEQDRPVRVDYIAVARLLKAAGYGWLLGRWRWSSGAAWSGYVRTSGGSDAYVHCDDWPRETLETAIAAPRDGKEYGWGWSYGEWRKIYYARCDECYVYHDPAFAHCATCGKGMRALDKQGRCTRCRKEAAAG